MENFYNLSNESRKKLLEQLNKELEDDLAKAEKQEAKNEPPKRVDVKKLNRELAKDMRELEKADKVESDKKRLDVNKLNSDLEKDLEELNKHTTNAKNYFKSNNYDEKLLEQLEELLKDYDVKIIKNEQLRFSNRKVRLLEIRYKTSDSKSELYTRENILLQSQKVSNFFNDNGVNGEIASALKFDDIGWKHSQITRFGNPVDLFVSQYTHYKEQKHFKAFNNYIVLKPKEAPKKAGNDINNDCLYNCLKYYLQERINKYWKDAGDFKRFCGVKRFDKVPINNKIIGLIESRLKTFQINITGSFIHSSIIKSIKQLNLIYEKGHITVNKTFLNSKLFNCKVSYTEKEILLYDKFNYECYDGNIKRILGLKEYHKVKNGQTKYILIDRTKQTQKERASGEYDLIKEYHQVIKTANLLKEKTNGVINLYKSGNIKETALNLFDRFSKYLFQGDQVQQDEANWIESASNGALRYAKKGYIGEGVDIDIKSQYSSIMISKNCFPIKRGEFQKLLVEDFEKLTFYSFGIYRCKVHKSKDFNVNKLFNFNDKNYYPHISLQDAKQLGLKIELIIDDEPNFLYYSRDKVISYEEVFETFVKYLFPFKEAKIDDMFKMILNILWGSLCEKNSLKQYQDNLKPLKIKKNYDAISFCPNNKNENVLQVICVHITDKYKTGFARIAPFLLSKGRSMLMNLIKDYKQDIVQINTDGCILSVPIEQTTLKFGSNIGDLVIKHKYQPVEIVDVNHIIWSDDI